MVNLRAVWYSEALTNSLTTENADLSEPAACGTRHTLCNINTSCPNHALTLAWWCGTACSLLPPEVGSACSISSVGHALSPLLMTEQSRQCQHASVSALKEAGGSTLACPTPQMLIALKDNSLQADLANLLGWQSLSSHASSLCWKA